MPSAARATSSPTCADEAFSRPNACRVARHILHRPRGEADPGAMEAATQVVEETALRCVVDEVPVSDSHGKSDRGNQTPLKRSSRETRSFMS